MAYRRAASLLLFATAHLCFVSTHNTAAVSFSYDFSKASDQEKLWHANGNSSAAGDRINITKMDKWSTGRVAYKEAVRLWDDRTGERASFQTSFTFTINGNPDEPTWDRGDGMAFFIGPFPPSLPWDSDGAFLGLFTNNKSWAQATVGVEFDTLWNPDWDPNDITTDHVGIEVGNIANIINHTKDLANGSLSGTMEATITYNATSMVATLRLANGTSVSVQATLDFKDDVAGLGPDAAVGFSAATGGLFESHQLLSWSFKSTDLPSNKKIQLWVILLLSAASASLIGLVAALLCYIMRRKPSPDSSIHTKPPDSPIPIIELEVAREFSYNELSAATSDFSKDRELGAGTFGKVYRGELQDSRMPQVVAVKKLTRLMEQTRKDFVTEITTLGHLRHRNLVKLLGWCSSGELLLVYELVTNGSLDEHLHGSQRLLNWPERYKVVRGIGSAIEYLHTGKEKPILHRDIKPSNVMLDDAFEAKLGDFGLVRQVDPEQGGYLRGTGMIGSWEYMDPECITAGSATMASDMYSFGVLLLEIATGKNPVKLRQELARPNALVETVRESYGGGNVLQMADQRLNGDFEEWQMERVLIVGLLCVLPTRRDRPGIRHAVNLLSDPGHPVPQVRV